MHPQLMLLLEIQDLHLQRTALLEEPDVEKMEANHFNIDPAEGRIRAGSRHQADGPCTWAKELGTGIDQYVADRQAPSLRYTFLGRIM